MQSSKIKPPQNNYKLFMYMIKNETVRSCLLGIAWIWLLLIMCATHVGAFSIYANGTNTSFTISLTIIMFAGVALGWWQCYALNPQKQNIGYLPTGLFFSTIVLGYLTFITHLNTINTTLSSQRLHLMHLALSFFALSFCGGLYLRPIQFALNKICQRHAKRYMIFICTWGLIFISAASLLTMAVKLLLPLNLHFLFLLLAIGNVIVGLYILKIIPHAMVQSFVKYLLRACFQVKVDGIENYNNAGDKILIIANHGSYLDMLLLAAFMPDKLHFAISNGDITKYWLKPIMKLIDVAIISPADAMSTKGIIKSIQHKNHYVMFPEGRLSTTGTLMKIYETPALIADKAGAMVVPIRIDGLRDSIYSSFMPAKSKTWFPKVTLTVLPPVPFTLNQNIKGRDRREILGTKLYDTMTKMMFESSNIDRTIFQALLDARKNNGGHMTIVEDEKKQTLTYNQLILKSYVLGQLIQENIGKEKTVGLMIANSLAATVSFFAMHALHVIPAMINFSAGFRAAYNSCIAAEIKIIITARKFIAIAELQPLIDKLEQCQIKILYLEDMAEHLSIKHKIKGAYLSLLDHIYKKSAELPGIANQPAVILFTSGSEGTPKGVVLSHRNILANQYQLSTAIDFNTKDISLNFLPMFHSFGLTTGTLLPILTGMKVVLYPSPLHYRIIPEIIYDRNVTMIFATNTFLAGYGASAHAYDFYSVRFIFAGAEALKDTTRQLYNDKFGIRILEGYGVTETAPVVAVNTNMQYKKGSVGRPLPGIETKLEKVDGIAPGGKLLLKGPNIMLGYLKADQPGIIQPPVNGWHDTGDIVDIDDNGYITIKGRAKRFIKIGGEMISLLAVEAIVQECWPDAMHAIVSKPDPIKGEQLVLITASADANIHELLQFAKKNDIPEIQIPRNIVHWEEIPILGSGKIDIVTIQQRYLDQSSISV